MPSDPFGGLFQDLNSGASFDPFSPGGASPYLGLNWSFDTPTTREWAVQAANSSESGRSYYREPFGWGEPGGLSSESGAIDQGAALAAGWEQTPLGWMPKYDPNNVYGYAYGPGNSQYNARFDANGKVIPGTLTRTSLDDPMFGLASAALTSFLGSYVGWMPPETGGSSIFAPGDLGPLEGAESATGFGAGGWDAATGTFTGPSETAMAAAGLAGAAGFNPEGYTGPGVNDFAIPTQPLNFGLGNAVSSRIPGWTNALGGLYGLLQARKLRKASQPLSDSSLTDAELKAIQRSMAAQGYQGSGNMMAAIAKGAVDKASAVDQSRIASMPGQMAALQAQMSSLGLLGSSIPKIWPDLQSGASWLGGLFGG